MLKKMMVVSVVMGVLLTACSQSPMEQLQSDVRADNLTSAYWATQKDDDPVLWQEATNYCKVHSAKVNCAPLTLSNMISNGSTKMMAYGQSGDVINVHGTNSVNTGNTNRH